MKIFEWDEITSPINLGEDPIHIIDKEKEETIEAPRVAFESRAKVFPRKLSRQGLDSCKESKLQSVSIQLRKANSSSNGFFSGNIFIFLFITLIYKECQEFRF